MSITGRRTLLRICGSLCPLFAIGQTLPDDTTSHEMKTVVVTSKVATTSVALRRDGTLSWDARSFGDLPKLLGNADPIRYAQTLPGVQTNSELDAGLHIQGCDNTHNQLSIQGVPIYNATHLLGFFSVFNASHYEAMTLKKSANRGADASRLGGMVSMELPGIPTDTLGGELSVGLISSQGTLRFPLGRKSGLALSGRGSYLNLLYSRWLSWNEMSMRYSFFDTNATWTWQPNVRHSVWVDAYMGQDKTKMSQDEYLARIGLKWRNLMTAAHWHYRDPNGLALRSTFYYTSYHNKLYLRQADMLFHLPSDISTLGYKGNVAWGGWNVGAGFALHDILPQAPQSEGLYNRTLSSQSRYKTQEYIAYATYTHMLSSHLESSVGLRTSAYTDYTHTTHFSADPSVDITYTRANWQLTANYSMRHQYIFQTGTTSLGMPTEFWTSIGEDARPQWGHNVSLTASVYLWEGRYRVSFDAYYKRLFNQIEYDGDMMKFLNTDYNLQENLLHGNGHNYGVSVTILKRTGKITGWLGYAFGRARRRFTDPSYKGVFSASHERPHELNAVATYRVSRRWTLSGTYVFASGTPFTAPSHFYILNGLLNTEYGNHNGHRLRPYSRLDLSVNFLFCKSHGCEHGLNFSVYNVTGRNNDITCRLKVHNGRYRYSHFSLIRFQMPSVNYYLKF